ncbi:MAG TPA: hypothetical protein VK961_08315 [Chthoniobacter sp.]|nr:hypothetical protein [Chthoniobacter sp.]
MNRSSLLLSLAAAIAWAPIARAETPLPSVTPVEAPPITTDAYVSPAASRNFDFAGESISDALRKLARAAKMNIVVADGVEGVVNIRIEDKSPKDAMMIIIEAKDLVFNQGKGGVYYIRSKNPPIRITEADKAAAGKPSARTSEPTKEEASSFFAPAFTGLADAMLDYQASPEVARKRARAKKALYDAFVAQGFTKEEALRLILANRETSPFGSGE